MKLLVLGKKSNMVVEGLLFGVFDLWNRNVTLDSKAVGNSREQVNLEGSIVLNENLLCLVSQLDQENRVSLSSRDDQGLGDPVDLINVDERGMSCGSNVQSSIFGKLLDDEFGAKTVSNAAQELGAVLLAHMLQVRVNKSAHGANIMSLKPFWQRLFGVVGLAIEDIGDENLVLAQSGELVGQESDVNQLNAIDVGEDNDDIVVSVVSTRDVTVDAVDGLEGANVGALVDGF